MPLIGTCHDDGVSRPRHRLLIVEDDPLITVFMTKALQTKGYDVASVGTGAAAVEAVQRGGLDLVMLDLGLPDTDGLDVLRTVRTTQPDLPVLVVTSRSDPGDRAVALSLGVSGYVVKPFPLATLLAAVGESLHVTID